ncbi:MAG: hypothetical protein WB615_16410 [Candidatus Tumulicola sp.]
MDPNLVAFDSHGDIFTDNNNGSTAWVVEFQPPYTAAPAGVISGPPYTSGPAATITSQVDVPTDLAISVAGNLYVLNRPGGGPYSESYVAEFTPPFTSASTPTGIATGMSGPGTEQIAIPAAGYTIPSGRRKNAHEIVHVK